MGLPLRTRLDVDEGARKISNFILAVTGELKAIARICSKKHLHDLDKTDLVAINPELARITGVALAWHNELTTIDVSLTMRSDLPHDRHIQGRFF